MTPAMLVVKERVVIDRVPLEEMWKALGPERAERMVGDAIEDLAERLSRANGLWRRGEVTDLGRLAGQIAPSAERLGMAALARIAAEVAVLCGRGDPAALGAVTGRMMRVGESSLSALWNAQDFA